MFVEDSALSHETLVHQCRITYLNAGCQNEIYTLDTASQAHWSCFIGVDRTILKTAHAYQFCKVTDTYVLNRTAVEDAHMRTDITMVRSLCVSVGINHPL